MSALMAQYKEDIGVTRRRSTYMKMMDEIEDEVEEEVVGEIDAALEDDEDIEFDDDDELFGEEESSLTSLVQELFPPRSVSSMMIPMDSDLPPDDVYDEEEEEDGDAGLSLMESVGQFIRRGSIVNFVDEGGG